MLDMYRLKNVGNIGLGMVDWWGSYCFPILHMWLRILEILLFHGSCQLLPSHLISTTCDTLKPGEQFKAILILLYCKITMSFRIKF